MFFDEIGELSFGAAPQVVLERGGGGIKIVLLGSKEPPGAQNEREQNQRQQPEASHAEMLDHPVRRRNEEII